MADGWVEEGDDAAEDDDEEADNSENESTAAVPFAAAVAVTALVELTIGVDCHNEAVPMLFVVFKKCGMETDGEEISVVIALGIEKSKLTLP